MIRDSNKTPPPAVEPAAGRPELSAEQWLGRTDMGPATAARRLWERLNPRHRRMLRVLARALALRQGQGRLPEDVRARLAAAVEELERLAARIEKFLTGLPPRRD